MHDEVAPAGPARTAAHSTSAEATPGPAASAPATAPAEPRSDQPEGTPEPTSQRAPPTPATPLPTHAGAATGPAGLPGDTGPGRLVLIGTGHVFRIDAAVRGAIMALRPDVVFVELDKGRLQALLHREQTGQVAARGGFVHQRLQRFQESVAQLYGAQVGNEMLAAVQAGQDIGARVALIDAPGEATVKRALGSLTFRERMRAVGQLLGAGIKRLMPQRKDARQAMEAEIRRYERDPDAAIQELQRQYPTVWRVLIDERDERMASAIRSQLHGVACGVAVLGDGHIPGVLRRLAGIDTTVYRLTDVRNDRLPRPEGVASGTSGHVSFTFQVDVG